MSSTFEHLTYLAREKVITVTAIVAFLVAFPLLALPTYVVLGQGHFLITYLYQARGKKITKRYLALYIPTALILFFLAATWFSFDALMLLTGTVFAVHFFYDELRLMPTERLAGRLLCLLPPVVMFSAMLARHLVSFDIASVATTLVILFVATLIVVPKTRRLFLSPSSLYVNSATLLLILIHILKLPVTSEILFSFIILFHYGTWYVHFYHKLYPYTAVHGRFVAEVLSINAVIVVGSVLYVSLPSLSYLEYFYEPTYFYVWTLLHITFASHDLFSEVKETVQS